MPEKDPSWLAFARVVAARPNAIRVAVRDRNGRAGQSYKQTGWPSRQPAEPYAVYLADQHGRFRTVAFDLDAGPATPLGPQLDRLHRLLDAAGIRHVEVYSGPSPHKRHLLCTFPDGLDPRLVAGVARAVREQVAPSLDLSPLCNPATGAIRPPGSPHRDGGRARVAGLGLESLACLQQGSPAAAFARLAVFLGVPLDPAEQPRPHDDLRARLARLPRQDGQPHLGLPCRGLNPRMSGLMINGDVGGEYPSRSNVAFAVAVAAVQTGWTFADFRAAADSSDNVGLDHLRLRHLGGGRYVPRTDRNAATERMWIKAVEYVLRHPAVRPRNRDVDDHIDQIRHAVAERSWGGQGGPGELAVLTRLLELAQHHGTLVVGQAVRPLSLGTSLSKSSSARALQRLQASGWVELETRSAGRASAAFRLTIPTPSCGAVDHLADAPDESDGGGTLGPAPLMLRGHDTGTADGLGRFAALVADHLAQEPASPTDVSRRTGLCARTIRRHLQRLEAAGVVGRDGSIWQLRSDRLDPAAVALGVSGATTARVRRYADERLTYAWWLADHHAEHGYLTERGLRRPGRRVDATGRRTVPTQPFPRRSDGRRSWTAGLALVADGGGLQPDELVAAGVDGRLPDPAEPHARPRSRPLPSRAAAAGSARPVHRPRRRSPRPRSLGTPAPSSGGRSSNPSATSRTRRSAPAFSAPPALVGRTGEPAPAGLPPPTDS